MPLDNIFPKREKVEPSSWRSKLSYRLGKAGRRASEWAANAKQSIKDAPKNIAGGLARVWNRGKEAFHDARQTARNIGAGFRIDDEPGFGEVANDMIKATGPRMYRKPMPEDATKNQRDWQHIQDFNAFYKKNNPPKQKTVFDILKERREELRREEARARQAFRDEYNRKYRGAPPPPQQQRPE